MEKTPILFVTAQSVYKTLSSESFDIDRDARSYTGTRSIVAHPPCRTWGRMKYFAKPRADEKELAIYSISLIRRIGGVLEHPAGSSLFKEMGISLKGKPDQYGGYIISIDQSWFGHRAQKKTYLYICGCEVGQLPAIPLSFNAITHVISKSKRSPHLIEVKRWERMATPLALAKWLIKVANICEANKPDAATSSG